MYLEFCSIRKYFGETKMFSFLVNSVNGPSPMLFLWRTNKLSETESNVFTETVTKTLCDSVNKIQKELI